MAQILIALMGLTFEIEDGRNWQHTYIEDETVHVSNLTCFFYHEDKAPINCPQVSSTLAMAHLYGEQLLSYGCGLYNATADILNFKLITIIFAVRRLKTENLPIALRNITSHLSAFHKSDNRCVSGPVYHIRTNQCNRCTRNAW